MDITDIVLICFRFSEVRNGAVKKVPGKRQAVPKGAACKIFVEKGLVQWKNQPFGGIMDL